MLANITENVQLFQLWIISYTSHWGRVTHICVVELGHHWFRQWLVACSAPSHYLNQCRNIVNCTFRNKLQWNFNQNSNIFIKKLHLKTSSAKWRLFCLCLNELIWYCFDPMHHGTRYKINICQIDVQLTVFEVRLSHNWLSFHNWNSYCCSRVQDDNNIWHTTMYRARHTHIHIYRKISNISLTKSQNLNVSRLGLQLSLHNILKPSVKWRMKI